MRSETAGHIAWTLPVRKAVAPPAEGHGEEEPVPRYLRLLVRLTSILIKVTEPSIPSLSIGIISQLLQSRCLY